MAKREKHYEIEDTIEDANGYIKTNVVVVRESEVESRRAHLRSITPLGQTRTIKVTEQKR